MPDFGEYSLDAILAQYQSAAADEPPAPAESAVSIAARSRRIVMEALGETLRQHQEPAEVSAVSEPPQEDPLPAAEAVADTEATKPFIVPLRRPAAEAPAPDEDEDEDDVPEEIPHEVSTDDAEEESKEGDAPPEKPRPIVTVGEDGIITIRYVQTEEAAEGAEPEDEEPPADEPPESETVEDAAEESAGIARPRPQTTHRSPPKQADAPSFTERFLAPLVRMVAVRIARRQMRSAEAKKWPEPVELHEAPELSPLKAAKFYAYYARSMRLRGRIALFLCVILAWIALGLPMAGMLGRSLRLQAGVSLVLTLAVMMAALDVFTAGIRQLFDMSVGAEALAALSALFACVDAALVLLGFGSALPFCAVAGVSLTAALWGERLTCTARMRTFKTAASSKAPSVLSPEAASKDGTTGLLRSERETTEGIVRRAEEPDFCRTVYTAASPLLLLAALVLSLIAALGGNSGYFLHTLSALIAISASFSAFFSFSLPYAMTARRLRASGAALVGYAGCADIGKTHRIVITDEDLFPPGTMKFSEINVQEGVFVAKVVADTAALLEASGSGVTSIFRELITRRGYTLPEVEQFRCHEGGGLSGIADGDRVLVGSAGFMNLMGIRLPQNLTAKNSICTAIGDELVGVFVIDYIPVTSVQDALVTLLRGRTQAIFAIRDFNITPLMIRQLFRVPTDNFHFPAFRDRYRIAAEAARTDAPIDAVITRNGVLPLADAAEAGRKLYNTARLSTILSLVGTAVGMVIMFLLCRVASFETASAGNMLSFMLLWALPVAILSVGQNR